MTWLILQLLVWIGAALASALFTRCYRAMAPQWELWDKPQSEHHKNHTRPTAVVGGFAMWSAWIVLLLAGLLVACVGQNLLPLDLQAALTGIPSAAKSLLVIILGATALAIMGLCDDKHAMKASRKFLVQFLVAVLTAVFGPRVLVGIVPVWLSWFLTAFWIALVINAMNFFDNMNGLTAGVSLIAFAFLFSIAVMRGQYFVGLLTALGGGVALGFLFFNYPNATGFMGDCGSHFLGYLLAITCIITTFYHHENTPSYLALAIPLMVLAVPLLDAATVVLIRLKLHKPIYVGDNRHLSHRFVQVGLSRALSVAAIWLLSLLAGFGALALIWLPPLGALLILTQLVVMVALILLIQLGSHPPEN